MTYLNLFINYFVFDYISLIYYIYCIYYLLSHIVQYVLPSSIFKKNLVTFFMKKSTTVERNIYVSIMQDAMSIQYQIKLEISFNCFRLNDGSSSQ